jgi:uncharacterized repeat protein (TIGR04138 family)
VDPDPVRVIEELADRQGKFRPEAYFFILRALEFTRRRLQLPGHVTGRELSEGARDLALEEFGPMAFNVMSHWGLTGTLDLGRIVYDLIEAELLRKTDEDSIEDFAEVYDFREAFEQGYRW